MVFLVPDLVTTLPGIEIADMRRFGDGGRMPPCAAFPEGGDLRHGNVPESGASKQ
jgi:hypothetical protein